MGVAHGRRPRVPRAATPGARGPGARGPPGPATARASRSGVRGGAGEN